MDDIFPNSLRRDGHAFHELRTALTVALGRVQMMRRWHREGRLSLNPDGDLATVERALIRMAAAVKGLEQSP